MKRLISRSGQWLGRVRQRKRTRVLAPSGSNVQRPSPTNSPSMYSSRMSSSSTNSEMRAVKPSGGRRRRLTPMIPPTCPAGVPGRGRGSSVEPHQCYRPALSSRTAANTSDVLASNTASFTVSKAGPCARCQPAISRWRFMEAPPWALLTNPLVSDSSRLLVEYLGGTPARAKERFLAAAFQDAPRKVA